MYSVGSDGWADWPCICIARQCQIDLDSSAGVSDEVCAGTKVEILKGIFRVSFVCVRR